MQGFAGESYRVVPDAAVTHDGEPSLRLEPIGEAPGDYATWMRTVDPVGLLGQRIRIIAFTRSEGATDRADFWARAQGPDSPNDGPGLGGAVVDLRADAEWVRHELVFDVDQAAVELQYGVGLAGRGRLWVAGVSVESVSLDVPLSHYVSAVPSSSAR